MGARGFVGRERDLGELRTAMDAAAAGQGSLVLVAGEAGIGKSRLAEELAVHARAVGAQPLWGRCWEGEGAPAFWPWIQVIREYARDCDQNVLRAQLGTGAADVARLVPEVARRYPELPAAPAAEQGAARFRLFDAVAAFLRRAAAERPLLLVLDFFVSEVLRLLASQHRAGPWPAAGPGLRGLGLPHGVRAVVERRLAQRSRPCAGLLSAAAVLGQEFRLDLLELVAELPRARVTELLEEAADLLRGRIPVAARGAVAS
jgi:predicted ATPase